MMKKRELLSLFIVIMLFVLGLMFKDFISASIFDAFAVSQSASLNITIVSDTTPPDLIIVSPIEGTTYTSTDIDLKYSVSDSGSGVDSVWYNLNNGANTTITTNTTFTVAGNGNYILYMFAKDRSGNENDTESVSFTVNIPTPGPTGQATGGEGTGGSKKIGFPRFDVTPEVLKVKLKQGETKSETVTVENTGETILEFVIDLTDVKKFAVLSDYAFDLLPGQSKKITAAFTASVLTEPDVYTGWVFVKTKELVKNIITVIEVESREPLFDVKMSIPQKYKNIIAGNSIVSDITIINMGDVLPVDINMDYVIKDLNGNVIDMQQETVAAKDLLSITKRMETPKDLKIGDYVFYVKVYYDGSFAMASDLFSIIGLEEKRPSWLAQQFSKVSYSRFIIAVIALMLITALIVLVRKKRKKKTKQPLKQKVKEKPFKEEALKEKSELKKLVDHIRNNLKWWHGLCFLGLFL